MVFIININKGNQNIVKCKILGSRIGLKRSGANVASLAHQNLAVATQQNSSPSLRNRSSRSRLILSPKVRSIKGEGWLEPKALTLTFIINFSLK